MKICQNCKTNQVQRISDRRWRTLCRCRHCRFEMYDSLSSDEYEGKLWAKEFISLVLTGEKDERLWKKLMGKLRKYSRTHRNCP